MKTAADGQVAASATAVHTAVGDVQANLVLANTSASTTETVVVTLLRVGSTARRITRAVLLPNEQLFVSGIPMADGDILKATTTNASTVDYTVSTTKTDVPFAVQSFDASGLAKQTATAASTNTMTVGASTAGLGTNSGTAAALPAGTAMHYPTTAADDTVGVILNAADQVTGRTVFIGNGVSNKILKIYPPSGGTINGAAGDAAYSTASGKGAWVTCLSGAGNTWRATG